MEHYEIIHCKSEEEKEQAFEIRREVFVVGQNISETIERDGKDDEAEHFLGFADAKAVAAARFLVLEKGLTVQLGRMAVLKDYRRQGIGRQLLKFMLGFAKEKGAKRAILNAQANVRGFYYAYGFVEDGEPFMEAGLPHQPMVMAFDDTKR